MRSRRLLRLLGLSAALLIRAPARIPALAQLSAPYDPDFAPEAPQRKEAPSAAPAAAPEEPPEVELVLPAGLRPFLLRDRPDPKHLFEQPVEVKPEEKPREFLEFERGLRPFRYTTGKWNDMRRHLEEGTAPSEEGFVEYISSGPAGPEAGAPKPPPPEIELPSYGTSLSVTGRKVIGVSYQEQRFTHEQVTTGRPKTTNLINITQELQLRMQGKVGPKITVNVNYDDTKTNQQDISVVYTGDPNEVVQNVSFGDIDLSLPATEFVSYNKQLFGIRADVKYKGLKASFIGSRTKGTTKSKQFFGNNQFVATDLLDTAYLRRQYYDLSFTLPARLPIRAGSERVYLAQQVQGSQTNVNSLTLTVSDLGLQTSSFTGTFTQLNPGSDYTIDYVKGVINFRNQLQPQFVVGVDFVDASGNSVSVETSSSDVTALPLGSQCREPNNAASGALAGQPCPRLIKTVSDVPIVSSSTEVGFNRELKTYYNIGQTQIVRDNGRGNFILRVIDPVSRAETGSTLLPVEKYPDTIFVDFENGIFNLLQPFSISNSSPTIPDPGIYAQTPISKRLIHLEYNYRFKTFFLEPNLVVQSEVVLLDNVKLNRNVDYFIDYDAGFVTFFNPDRIGQNSEIDITYEVAPFAGLTNDSLLGTRFSYDFSPSFSVGTTLLYETGNKAQTTPDITQLARSLLVYDFDSQLKNKQLAKKLKLTSFSGELAQSRQNPNLNGYAIIDNMEGIKQEDVTSTLASQWFIASNPGGVESDPSKISWASEDFHVLDINPRAQASSQDTQKVLSMSYDFSNAGSQEMSIVFPFSASGVDFSQRSILEVVMLGDNSGNDINFRLGSVNEDADGAGGTTLNCADGRVLKNAPKTEDVDCDGVLQPSEDNGWLYVYTPDPSKNTRFGAGNGRIDSEDLEANGVLAPDDGSGNNFGYGPDLSFGNNPNNHLLFSASDSSTHTVIDFGNVAVNGSPWQTFQIPLNISSATTSGWTSIRQARISIRHRSGGAATGTLRFARVAVVGNTWLAGQALDPNTGNPPVGNEGLTVTPVNNVDNPGYVPIFNAGGDATAVFNNLYGSVSQLQQQTNSKNLSEQALQMEFSNMTISGGAQAVVTTKRLFTKPVDVSQHKHFNFLLYGNADPNNVNNTDHTFFLRAGNDRNYFEVQVPLNFVGWREISVLQTSSNNNAVADGWAADTPGTVVTSTGTPSLQQVAEIVAGVRRTASITAGSDPSPTRGRIWLNEIHVSQPQTRIGNARKLDVNFEYTGWGSFGAKYREIDRNFQTPTSVVSNQDNRQDSGYLNLTRLPFLPMTFNLSRQIAVTPNTNATGNLSNLVNLLQQGKVTTWNGTASGNFTLGALPRLSAGYTRNRIEYDLLTRLDDRKTYNGTLQYGIPGNVRVLPKTVDANYSWSRYDVTFQRPDILALAGNFNTAEFTQTTGLKLTFVPWTGSSFNPNYSLTKVKENRQDFTSGAERDSSYPKSINETAGFTSNFKLVSWLNPQVSYTANILENNILTVSTFVVDASTFVFNPGDIKTVNRTANGSVSLPLTIGDIFKSSKLFKSFNIVSGYQLQDGDVWNNVEKELDSRYSLWVRQPLHPRNPAAALTNLTLRDTYNSTQRWSPLEAYNITGRKAALKTFSLSNNFVRSIQRTNTSGTYSKTISTTFPDAVASMSQLEQLLHSERWMSNTQMNLKYAAHKTENVGLTINTDQSLGSDLRSIIRKRFDTLVSMNLRTSTNKDLLVDANTQKTAHQDATAQVTFTVKKFTFTPKTDYAHDVTTLGTGIKTQDLTVITPSVLARADLSLPRGLRLPGSTKTLLFTNRVIWTTTISLAYRHSPVTLIDNSKLLALNTSADYELAKNLRMTLNGAASRLWHDFLAEEDFISYSFGMNLTFQF